MNAKRRNVAIICGGRSSEHEISCISAKGVMSAIDLQLFNPILIGITKSGQWRLLKEISEFEVGDDDLPCIPDLPGNLRIDRQGIWELNGENLNIDIAFPLLHGAYGEDGTIQGLFEMAGIAYVGSGVLASAVAMDKTFAKPIYADFGLRVADGITVHQRDWLSNQAMELAKITALGLPIFIKPARSGSSRGTTKVKRVEDIAYALAHAHEHDPRALVEVAISGREVECAVLEIEGNPHASVVGEIRVHEPHEFYDFEAKYLDGSTSFDVPANLSEEISNAIREAAATAFLALGCEGLARVDFFLTSDNDLIINELNTMPGFTPRSVFPLLWEATGKSYKDLITQLCQSAQARSQSVVR